MLVCAAYLFRSVCARASPCLFVCASLYRQLLLQTGATTLSATFFFRLVTPSPHARIRWGHTASSCYLPFVSFTKSSITVLMLDFLFAPLPVSVLVLLGLTRLSVCSRLTASAFPSTRCATARAFVRTRLLIVNTLLLRRSLGSLRG